MRKRTRPADYEELAGSSSPVSKSPLVTVSDFTIPAALASATFDVLVDAGERGLEAFVLWGGNVADNCLAFRSLIVPDQVGHVTNEGLLVTVDGMALFHANKEFYRRGELMAAQVHSHPTEAFHSGTDDCFSLVTLAGALSIVIPNFGRGRFHELKEWALYRLHSGDHWTPLTSADRVQVVDLGEET